MDSTPGRFAVIATRGRPDELQQCVAALAPQVDRIVVVDNNDKPTIWDLVSASRGQVIHRWDPTQPPNLSKLWNIGLNVVLERARGGDCTPDVKTLDPYDVAVVNDDAIVPAGWFEAVTSAMRQAGAAAGCSTNTVSRPALCTVPGTTPLSLRLTGYAFILRGETGLRFDEQFHWWCGDNDIDMQARQAGGTLLLPGYPVEHLHPDQSTRGVLAERTAVDMQLFVDKWGFRPW